jgi:hypothetical protein
VLFSRVEDGTGRAELLIDATIELYADGHSTAPVDRVGGLDLLSEIDLLEFSLELAIGQ